MSGQRIHVHLLHRKMNVRLDIKSKQGLFRPRVDKSWGICVLLLGFLFCLVVSSEAGMVYGRVSAEDRPLKREDTITFFDEKKNLLGATTVDERGGYTISLPQGIFRVEFRGDGGVWEGWIQSTPQSVRQDIYLKKMMR
jgi:hypothetical protein